MEKNWMKTIPILMITLMLVLAFPSSGDDDITFVPVSDSKNGSSVLEPFGNVSGGEPIRIAGCFAMTGDMSSLDLPAAKGAELAAKEINESGGVLGRPLQIVFRDSQSRIDIIENNSRLSVEEDGVVAGIGFCDTDSVMAAGPVFQNAGLPFITVGATSPRIPDQIGDMVYLACFGDNVQASAGAEFAGGFGQRGALLWDRDMDYTSLLAGYFRDRFIELGGTLIFDESFADNATDISGKIEAIKALQEQPDFYYIAAMPYNVGQIVRQFRKAGLTGPIIGGDGYDTPDLIGEAGNASDNVFFTTHALMDEVKSTEGIRRFIPLYRSQYGHDPENAFAALGYDTVYLLADAISRAGSTEPKAIQRAIDETRYFSGVTGTISYLDGGHVPYKSVTVIGIHDGALMLEAELVPTGIPAP